MKNIIVLNGSPHKNGNTSALLKAFLSGLKKGKKLTVTQFDAYALRVAPILASDFSGKKEKKDDMQSVLPKILAADLIVLATPLYYWGMSAQLKLVWERLFGTDYKLFKGKRLAILATGGGEDKKDSGADLIEAQYKNICAFMGMRFVGLCFASSEKQPVSKNKKALATAQALGKKAGKW